MGIGILVHNSRGKSRIPVQEDLESQPGPFRPVCACASNMGVPEGALEIVIKTTFLLQILAVVRARATTGQLFMREGGEGGGKMFVHDHPVKLTFTTSCTFLKEIHLKFGTVEQE